MKRQFRLGVLILAAVAAGKLGYQEYVFRSTAENVVVSTYGHAALKACTRQSKRIRAKVPNAEWQNKARIKLVVGNANLDVSIWQFNHRLWHARFRDPYLRLTTANTVRHATCDYDIKRRVATIARY